METQTAGPGSADIETPLPDLPEKIESAVGHLTMIAERLRAVDHSMAIEDAERIDAAMLLLAGLQSVICWEPDPYRFTPESAAEQIRAMAAIGPRPPAVVRLLLESAGHLTNNARPIEEEASSPDADLSAPATVGDVLDLHARIDRCELRIARIERARRLGAG